MTTEVQSSDWRKCGFTDGRHGNPSWAPRGDKESRRQYLEGYKAGNEELKKDMAQR